MTKRVIMIGFDGMPWHILRLLIDHGVMPNLETVVKQGTRATLKSTIPPYTSASWTSITSGTNPGKHGVFDFQCFRDMSHEKTPIDSLSIMCPRLHEMFLLNGLRAVIINLPHSYPFVKSKQLTVITDWLTPNLVVYPQKAKNLTSSYEYSANWDFDGKISLPELEGRIKAIKNVFDCTRWDMFFVVFSEPDWIMHMGYDAIVKYHKDLTPQIHKSFEILDRFVGHVIAKQNSGDLLVILSDHGFTAYNKIVYVNSILSRANLLHNTTSQSEANALSSIPDPRANEIAKKRRGVLFRSGISDVRALVSGSKLVTKIVKRISRSPIGYGALSSLAEKLAISYSIDFSCSKAFMYTSPFGIYINSKKMFRSGIVEPEMESMVADEIVKLLSRIHDPSTGSPLMSLVTTREKVYWGPYVERAPHVLFIPNLDGGYAYSQKFYPKIIERKKKFSHSMYGLLITYGKDTQSGMDLGVVDTYDVVPTVLHYLGLPVPSDCDGKILFDMFLENSDARNSAVKTRDYQKDWKATRAAYFREEKPFARQDAEKVKERLRKLGYL